MVANNPRLLTISMNGTPLGTLEKSQRGTLQFTYRQTWLDTPSSRPLSLSLPLTSKPYQGDIVFNFFDNLLPDNPSIRQRIQSTFKIASNHPFDLLANIGHDCVGAIQISRNEDATFEKSIRYTPLSEKKIATILRHYQSNPLGMSNNFKEFRISIAGAQEKAAFLYHKKKWGLPLSTTPTTHLFKLPIGELKHHQLNLSDSCENEWLCLQIAKAFGFNVAECHIKCFEDVKVLVVKRFDRKLSSNKEWILRLPQEDICQALGLSSNLKHQSDGGPGISRIMELLLSANNPTLERDTFFKTQILFWLLCAIDGHAKNFSLFIEPGGRYRLTPLYDILSAFPLIAGKQLHEKKAKMAMALKGKRSHYKFYEVRRSHFITTATKAGYSTQHAEQLLNTMLDQVDTVANKVMSLLPPSFPKETIAIPIFEGMKSMKQYLSSEV